MSISELQTSGQDFIKKRNIHKKTVIENLVFSNQGKNHLSADILVLNVRTASKQQLSNVYCSLALIVVHSLYRIICACLSHTPLKCTCGNKKGDASSMVISVPCINQNIFPQRPALLCLVMSPLQFLGSEPQYILIICIVINGARLISRTSVIIWLGRVLELMTDD